MRLMWPISDRFRRAVTTDAERITRIDLLTDPTADPIDITEWWVDGQVDLGRNEIRRSCSLTFEDDGLGLIVPRTAADWLAPFGNELRVWSGYRFPDDGTDELVPVGTFRIIRTTTHYPRVDVEGRDRAVNLQRAKFEKTRVIRRGELWDDVLARVLLERYPAAEIDFATRSDQTCPQVVIELNADPWEWLQRTAAQTLDSQLFCDPMGVFRLLPEEPVGGDTIPVWTFDGVPSSALAPVEGDWANTATYDMELDWPTDEMWNAVVITGTNKDNSAITYYGAAYDTDPDSPTWWNGHYGRNVLVEDSELVTSNQQAGRAAKTRLQSIAGIPEALAIGAIPNPAFEPGDAFLVRRPELGLDTVHLLDSAPLPLRAAAGAQRIGTRLRRVVPEP